MGVSGPSGLLVHTLNLHTLEQAANLRAFLEFVNRRFPSYYDLLILHLGCLGKQKLPCSYP